MNTELEKLLDFALVDGNLTDKKREILYRKANELGEDLDEFEMVLEAKLFQSQKISSSKPSTLEIEKPKSQKEGDIKKCPSCGAHVPSFQTTCTDCGHEFRNIKAASSIQKLYDEFQNIEESERSREKSWAQKLEGNEGVQMSVVTRQISALSSFPVPNTKEDLLEFLSIASSEASKKASWLRGLGKNPEYILKNAWRSKCDQIIKKSRLSMKDDKNTLEEIEKFAKQLGVK